MKKIIVMGIGSYILSDDGVGVHAIQMLAKENWADNVEIYECGTLGILSLHKVTEADILIAIDAVKSPEDKPGTIKVYDKKEIMLKKMPSEATAHELGFQELLLHADLRGECPEIIKLIGIVPETYETGVELSPSVAAALPKVIETARKIIKEYSE